MKKLLWLASCTAPVLAAVLCAGPLTALAQKSKTTLQRQAPFDVGSSEITPGFRGNSCPIVAAAVKRLSTKKDEFETSDAYGERLASLQTSELAAGLKVGDTMAFKRRDISNQLKYVADTGQMMVELSFGFLTYIPTARPIDAFVKTDIINLSTKSTREYRGSNAFGASVLVRSTQYEACAVAFKNLPAKPGATAIFADMTPDEARASKGHLAVLYVGKLTAPLLADFDHYSGPTINSPSEVGWSGDALIFNLDQMILYDDQTGKIYKRKIIGPA